MVNLDPSYAGHGNFCPMRKKCALAIKMTLRKSFREFLQSWNPYKANKIDAANYLFTLFVYAFWKNIVFSLLEIP